MRWFIDEWMDKIVIQFTVYELKLLYVKFYCDFVLIFWDSSDRFIEERTSIEVSSISLEEGERFYFLFHPVNILDSVSSLFLSEPQRIEKALKVLFCRFLDPHPHPFPLLYIFFRWKSELRDTSCHCREINITDISQIKSSRSYII